MNVRNWLCALLVAVVGGASPGAGDAQVASTQAGMRIKSARRAEKYIDNFTKTEFAAPNRNDVVLFLEIDGISVEEFRETEGLFVWIRPGGDLTQGRAFREKLDRKPSIVSSQDGPPEDRRIVVMVPRNTLNFTLHFGPRPPIPFVANEQILPIVR